MKKKSTKTFSFKFLEQKRFNDFKKPLKRGKFIMIKGIKHNNILLQYVNVSNSIMKMFLHLHIADRTCFPFFLVLLAN